jgi:hypothetical protein
MNKMKNKKEKKKNDKCYFCSYNEVEVKLSLYEREADKVKTIYACKICADYKAHVFLFFDDDLEKIMIKKIKENE